MTKLFPLLLCYLLPIVLSAQTNTAAPLRVIELQINDKVYKVKEGEHLRLDSVPGKIVVTPRISTTCTFTFGTLAFDYPENYRYTYSEHQGRHIWTLAGTDFSVLLFYFTGRSKLKEEPIDLDRFVEDIGHALPGSPHGTPIEKTLGGKLFQGQRLEVQNDDSGLHVYMDIFALNLDKNTRVFLVFRDVPSDDGIQTEESRQTQALVARTIRY